MQLSALDASVPLRFLISWLSLLRLFLPGPLTEVVADEILAAVEASPRGPVPSGPDQGADSETQLLRTWANLLLTSHEDAVSAFHDFLTHQGTIQIQFTRLHSILDAGTPVRPSTLPILFNGQFTRITQNSAGRVWSAAPGSGDVIVNMWKIVQCEQPLRIANAGPGLRRRSVSQLFTVMANVSVKQVMNRVFPETSPNHLKAWSQVVAEEWEIDAGRDYVIQQFCENVDATAQIDGRGLAHHSRTRRSIILRYPQAFANIVSNGPASPVRIRERRVAGPPPHPPHGAKRKHPA